MLEKYGIGAEVIGAALARLVSQIDKIDGLLAEEGLDSDKQLKLLDAQLKRVSELRQWATLERRVDAEAARAQSDSDPQAEEEEDDLTYAGDGEPRAGVMDWILKGAGDGDRGGADAGDLCFGYEAKAQRRNYQFGGGSGGAVPVSAVAAYGANSEECGPPFAGLADMVVHGRTRRWQDAGRG